MEQIDADLEYTRPAPGPASAAARMNALLILPVIGLALLALFIIAAVAQIDLSGFVDSLVGILLLLFAVMVFGLFWAMAPRYRSRH